jgi:hypothetical protein
MQRSLPCGILSQSGRDDIAHDAFVHLVGRNARASHCLAHHQRPQIDCAEAGERSLKPSDGRPHCRDDHHFFHVCNLNFPWTCMSHLRRRANV